MRGKILPAVVVATGLFLLTAPVWAKSVVVKSEAPIVTVDVPDGFASSGIDHGIETKTPDEGILVWIEVIPAGDLDALLKEHDAYWKSQGVDLGAAPAHVNQEVDGKKVAATDFKSATWKGEPTVVRYLLIDPALQSKKVIVLSMWASPEADKAHDADVNTMISSLDVKE